MNWSVLVVGATILFPGIWWVFRAKHRYINEGNSVLEDNGVVIDGVSILATEVTREFLHARERIDRGHTSKARVQIGTGVS